MTDDSVAAWQCQPGALDVAGNLRRLDAACAAAAARQAEVLVTPEMFTSGYGITPAQVLRHAEDAAGRPRPLSRRSRGGTASRSSTGTPSARPAAGPTTRRR